MQIQQVALIVEDDEIWQRKLSEHLELRKYEVRIAGSLDQAERLVLECCPEVITLDNSLEGGKQGLGLLPVIARSTPLARVIIVSSDNVSGDSKIESYRKLIVGILKKSEYGPSKFDALLSKPLGEALVIEDDKYRWGPRLKKILEDIGLRVLLIRGTGGAVAALRETAFDVITVDIKLASNNPENDEGIQLLEKALPGRDAIMAVISAHIPNGDVFEIYRRFEDVRLVLQKSAFADDSFVQFIRNALVRRRRPGRQDVSPQLEREVVQSLLRNYYSSDSQTLTTSTALADLGDLLDIPPSHFVRDLRMNLETAFQTLMEEAELEQFDLAGVASDSFSEPGSFTDALIKRMQGHNDLSEAAVSWWKLPEDRKSKRLEAILRLEWQYIRNGTKKQAGQWFQGEEQVRKYGIQLLADKVFAIWKPDLR